MSGNGEEGSKMVELTSMMMIAVVITATWVEELICIAELSHGKS
jgi:hypothetical protein